MALALAPRPPPDNIFLQNFKLVYSFIYVLANPGGVLLYKARWIPTEVGFGSSLASNGHNLDRSVGLVRGFWFLGFWFGS